MEKKVNVIEDLEGKKIVIIHDVRFAIPVHSGSTGEVLRYNIFFARMLVRHADDGNKYLYDILAVKKEK